MRSLSIILLATLAACSTPERLVLAPQVSVTEKIPSTFASIEVAEVSLPTYAASDEIAVVEDGALVLSGVLWADDPTRAVSLALARNIKEITGARVASEPWPFDLNPEARVDVRVEQLLVSDGTLRLSGQYFVADLDGRGRDHAHVFDLSRPLTDLSASSAAAERTALLAELAREIARDAL